jgi:hypothetical protein
MCLNTFLIGRKETEALPLRIRRSRIQVAALRLTIVTEIVCGFPQPLQANAGMET